MFFIRESIFLAAFLTVGTALICRTCQEDSCAEPTGWISEQCSPTTKWCYRLMNDQEKVYRAGCSAVKCENMNKPYNSKCNVCDSDNCNSPQQVDSNGPRIGGGVTWNTASSITMESKISLISSFVSFLLLFLLR
uniref:Uncharacterized protein n=1 Tax=Acrobeloides nanus TaxID=290746 RepID=A0A914DST1_9BILA